MTHQEVKDTAKSIIGNGRELVSLSKDRLKNPLISAFIFSFIAVNWKAILFLIFSSKSIENKITYVENRFTSYEYYLIFPLIAAIFYAIALPYIMLRIEKVNSKTTNDRKNNLNDEHVNDIIRRRNIAIEEIKLEKAKAELLNEENTNKQIENLMSDIKNKEQVISNMTDTIQSLQDDANAFLKEMSNKDKSLRYKDIKREYTLFEYSDLYKYFKQIGYFISHSEGYMTADINIVILDLYEKCGIIISDKSKNDFSNMPAYKFTERGKMFWDIFNTSEAINKVEEF